MEARIGLVELDALHAEVDALKRLPAETEALLASFTPALLAKVFRGTSIRHWPVAIALFGFKARWGAD